MPGILSDEGWENCNGPRTDQRQWSRPAVWYRRRLGPGFVSAGRGLYLKKALPVTLWQLEAIV